MPQSFNKYSVRKVIIYKSSSTTNIFKFLPTIIFSQVSCRTPRVSTSSLSKKGRFQSSDLQLPTPAFTGSVTGVGSFSAGGCFSTDGIFAPVVPVTGSATLGKDFPGQNPGVFFSRRCPKVEEFLYILYQIWK